MYTINNTSETKKFRKSYREAYMKLMDTVKNGGHSLKISTITVVGTLNHAKIELPKLQTYIEENEPHVQSKFATSHKEFSITKRGKIQKNFFNQLTLNFNDISKKSIKIFLNGKFQITGLSSLVETFKVVDLICKWLEKVSNIKTELQNLKVGLINSNFSYLKSIHLFKLHNELCKMNTVDSRYDPDTYPAINIKGAFDNKVSMFVFGSGNIVITGAVTLLEIEHAYIFITDLLNEKSVTYESKCKSQLSKRKEVVFFKGYPIKELLSGI